MDNIFVEGQTNLFPIIGVVHIVTGVIHSGYHGNHIMSQRFQVHVDRTAHHFPHAHLCRDAFLDQLQMFGTDAYRYFLGLRIGPQQALLFFSRERHLPITDLHQIAVAITQQFSVKKVHLRRTDKAAYELICRMSKDLLWRANLLDDTVLHNDNPVSQCHSLGLIVGDIHKGGVDALAKHQNLSTHLSAQLGIQVGQRLVHQKHLGFPDDGTADGHTLPLAAGKRLRFAIQQI